MNTPAHVVLNLTVLRTKNTDIKKIAFWGIVVGSLLPDIPMFVFFFVEAVINGRPQSEIWNQLYFHSTWQNFFDFFNSIPIILLGLAIAWYRRIPFLLFLFLSMLLHVALDFPLHHDDGHHHFFPFSSFRFDSPVSYWDPRHFGGIIAPLEAGLTVVGCIVLFFRASTFPAKLATALLGISYTLSAAAAYVGLLFA